MRVFTVVCSSGFRATFAAFFVLNDLFRDLPLSAVTNCFQLHAVSTEAAGVFFLAKFVLSTHLLVLAMGRVAVYVLQKPERLFSKFDLAYLYPVLISKHTFIPISTSLNLSCCIVPTITFPCFHSKTGPQLPDAVRNEKYGFNN